MVVVVVGVEEIEEVVSELAHLLTAAKRRL